jgi:prefoldin subunit 5
MGASTSLEAIAQKLEEKKKQELEDILRVSGSAAITKNEYGVTVVDDTLAASSLIFKPLTKSKYDNTELVKAINVNVKELKPNIPVLKKDLVPKPLYDEQVTLNADLNKKIEVLNTTISDLNGQIADLKAQVDTEINNRLNIEQSNDGLTNQLATLTKTVEDFTKQIQSAIQKSVDESILRASLQAQNVGYKAQVEALIKQIDSLNSIIEGLQAQLGAVQQQQTIQNATQNVALAAGGDAVNDVAVVVLENSSITDSPRAFFRIKSEGDAVQFIRGKTLKITNNDTMDIVVTVTMPALAGGRQAMTITGANSSNTLTFTLAQNGEKDIPLNINPGATADLDSHAKGGIFGGHTGSNSYRGGQLKISVLRKSNNVTKDVTYDWGFDKVHPNSW